MEVSGVKRTFAINFTISKWRVLVESLNRTRGYREDSCSTPQLIRSQRIPIHRIPWQLLFQQLSRRNNTLHLVIRNSAGIYFIVNKARDIHIHYHLNNVNYLHYWHYSNHHHHHRHHHHHHHHHHNLYYHTY